MASVEIRVTGLTPNEAVVVAEHLNLVLGGEAEVSEIVDGEALPAAATPSLVAAVEASEAAPAKKPRGRPKKDVDAEAAKAQAQADFAAQVAPKVEAAPVLVPVSELPQAAPAAPVPHAAPVAPVAPVAAPSAPPAPAAANPHFADTMGLFAEVTRFVPIEKVLRFVKDAYGAEQLVDVATDLHPTLQSWFKYLRDSVANGVTPDEAISAARQHHGLAG